MSSISAIVYERLLRYYKNMSKKKTNNESDGTYLLKIVMYVIFGSLWIKFATPVVVAGLTLNGMPFGLFIGLLFASHDHFQVDRKIEYAILMLMTILTYFIPAGIVI